MKCESCPALRTEGYEYPEAFCCIYGDDEAIEFKDGSIGCRHHLKTIEKRLAINDDYEAHRWDGIGEFYERQCKLEDAMEDAIIKACDLADVVFAYGDDNCLYKYPMTKEIPSVLHEFAWRFRAELEDLGYEIVKREDS